MDIAMASHGPSMNTHGQVSKRTVRGKVSTVERRKGLCEIMSGIRLN